MSITVYPDSSPVAWGEIQGTLSNQTDLQDALDAKANITCLVYRALLTQTGTDAPTAVVLENTLGGTVVWTYVSTGSYAGTLAGAFPVNKTALLTGTSLNVNGDYASIYLRRANDNAVDLSTSDTGSAADALLDATFIQILVYP